MQRRHLSFPLLAHLAAIISFGAAAASCSMFRTTEFDPEADLDRELSRAVSIVEKSVPVENPEKYRVELAPLAESRLGHYDTRTHLITLNSEVTWAVWEKTGEFEKREVYDPASVIAHEIACHDPALPLNHHESGWLTNPHYNLVRRVNRYDLVAHNGSDQCLTHDGLCVTIRTSSHP